MGYSKSQIARILIDSASYALTASNAGGGVPGGSDTQIQYNNVGVFGGVPNLTWSGSVLRATGSFTGSFTGSLFGTSSWAINALTTSLAPNYVLNSVTSSMLAPYVLTSVTSSMLAPYLLSSQTSSFATTGSNTFQGNQTINGDVIVTGSLTAQQYIISSSVIYITQSNYSGSNIFGNSIDDTHQFTGSVYITGSLTSPNITGSLFGTASWAYSASQAISSSYAATASYVNPLNQTVQITGSLIVSNSLNVIGTNTTTGSMLVTGSSTLIGNQTITGSLNITGSTTQIGNNSLFGNTQLSGSIIISGASGTNNPTVRVYGDTQHNGYLRFDPVTTNIDNSISASYIYVSGSTNDLYFTQNGAGYANTTRLRWLEGNLYTGLLHGGLITTQSSTVYQISSGSGIIVNLNTSLTNDPYPTVEFLNWPNLSSSISALSSSFDQQFVAISSSGGTIAIKAQGTPYNDGDYNSFIPIGIVIHQNRSTINAIQTFPGVGYGWKQRSFDFIKAFGPLKISGYTLAASGSSTRGLVLSGGTAWVDGRNYIVDPKNPSYIVEAQGIATSKIFRYYQSGSNWQSNWGYDTNGGAGYTNIDPTQYSNAGTLTSVPVLNWTIQRVFYFPNSATKAFYIYYGNAAYSTKADALAAVTTETFNEAPNTTANAIYVGYMLLRHNADFTVPASYEFRQAGLFRGSGTGGGGGGGATTLAGLTDVSLSSLISGDLLSYNAVTGLWNNTHTLTGSYTLSGSLVTNDGVSVQSLTASSVDISSSIGRLLINSTNFDLISGSGTNVPSINVLTNVLISDGADSVDWRNRKLHTSLGIDYTIDWQNSLLYDPMNAQNSIDWANRYLIDTAGTNKIDWQNSIARDSSNVSSIDWENRALQNTSGQDSVRWNSYVLYDPSNGSDSLDWIGRKVYGATVSGYYSIDWENRLLQDTTGFTALDWYDATSGTGIRLYGTASLALALPPGTYNITSSYATTASTADDFIVRGNLVVSGSTTIGDSTTDSITLTATTMSLGSGTGILNIDSNTLYVDGNNNRVGIGNSAPASQLHVGSAFSFMKVTPNWNSNTGTWIDLSTDGPSGIGTGGPGSVPWIAYTSNPTQWFLNSVVGDIAYKNSSGRLLFGNSPSGNSVLTVSSSKIAIGKDNPNASSILDITGSVLITGSLNITGGITGSLLGTSSWASNALTSSYVNTLNQNVLITGSLTVGATSLGSNENTLVVGPSPAGGTGEGGQILLQAVGGTYTSASMIDNYQDQFRILRGTNASSDAQYMGINMHTGQATLNKYTGSGAFGGTPTAKLATTSNGNILTVLNGYAAQLDLYSALGSTTKADPVFAQGGILGSTGITLSDGTGHGTAIHIPQQTTITGVRWYRTATGGAYTPDNYNGVGLYSYSGGTLTLVASSSNDGTIWSSSYAGTNTFTTKSFAASYNAAPGIYFVVGVYNSSAQTTAPILGTGPSATFNAVVAAYDYTNSAKHFFTVGVGANLASSLAISTCASSLNQAYFALY